MKRDADVEDLRLWAVVSSTVRPLRPVPLPPLHGEGQPARSVGRVGSAEAAANPAGSAHAARLPHPGASRPALPMMGREGREEAGALEPGLHRRIVRGREVTAARIDLHGMTYDPARAALTDFILRSVDQGWRAVLVITGKGSLGEGVIRRHAPDWLAAPPLREHIAGVSPAHRKHGGEGALYVALKRRG